MFFAHTTENASARTARGIFDAFFRLRCRINPKGGLTEGREQSYNDKRGTNVVFVCFGKNTRQNMVSTAYFL